MYRHPLVPRLALSVFATLAVQGAAADPVYRLIDLTPENPALACALAINAAGHVTGQIDRDGDYRRTAGFWWGEGVRVGIGTGDASGINDADTVVGTTDDMDERRGQRAYVVQGGVRHGIDVRGGVRYQGAAGVSAAGITCGFDEDADGRHAYAAGTDGRPFALDLPRQPTSSACSAISSDGRMTGVVQYHFVKERGFVGVPGNWTLLPMPHGSRAVEPQAVNALGTVTGVYYVPDKGGRGFVYKDGITADLPSLGRGSVSYGYGINDIGQIVGASYGTRTGAVLFETDGRVVELNARLDAPAASAGWVVETARAINLSGVIAGCGRKRDVAGHWSGLHALVLVPYQ
jgi:uncharacterized membrane protein